MYACCQATVYDIELKTCPPVTVGRWIRTVSEDLFD